MEKTLAAYRALVEEKSLQQTQAAAQAYDMLAKHVARGKGPRACADASLVVRAMQEVGFQVCRFIL